MGTMTINLSIDEEKLKTIDAGALKENRSRSSFMTHHALLAAQNLVNGADQYAKQSE